MTAPALVADDAQVRPALDAWTRTLAVLAAAVRDPWSAKHIDPAHVAPGAPRQLLRVIQRAPLTVERDGLAHACFLAGVPLVPLAAWFDSVAALPFTLTARAGGEAIARPRVPRARLTHAAWDGALAEAAARRAATSEESR